MWLKSTVEKESMANLNTAHSGAAKKKTKTNKQNLKQIYRKFPNYKMAHCIVFIQIVLLLLLLLLSFACFECVHQIPAK